MTGRLLRDNEQREVDVSNEKRVLVWDRFVRLFHWSLVICFFVAYGSSESVGVIHKGFGYATLALVFARVVWGFIGTRHARFADFVPGPRRLWAYATAMVRRQEPRYVGHNPAGSVMILFLLSAVAGIGVTGWMLTLDAFWGNGTVEGLHTLLVDATLLAVTVHVCANIYASLHHRENLIWSMVTGHKRPPDRDASADSARADRRFDAPPPPVQHDSVRASGTVPLPKR
jgi:cytochrome b